jgi:hypothetical protein
MTSRNLAKDQPARVGGVGVGGGIMQMTQQKLRLIVAHLTTFQKVSFCVTVL